MSGALIAGSLWVLASVIVALLPMRRQYVPGLALMLAAPLLVGWIGWAHGWLAGTGAALAFVSMYRNPLRYLWRRAKGEKPEIPK